jgi:hypothetical protein
MQASSLTGGVVGGGSSGGNRCSGSGAGAGGWGAVPNVLPANRRCSATSSASIRACGGLGVVAPASTVATTVPKVERSNGACGSDCWGSVRIAVSGVSFAETGKVPLISSATWLVTVLDAGQSRRRGERTKQRAENFSGCGAPSATVVLLFQGKSKNRVKPEGKQVPTA